MRGLGSVRSPSIFLRANGRVFKASGGVRGEQTDRVPDYAKVPSEDRGKARFHQGIGGSRGVLRGEEMNRRLP